MRLLISGHRLPRRDQPLDSDGVVLLAECAQLVEPDLLDHPDYVFAVWRCLVGHDAGRTPGRVDDSLEGFGRDGHADHLYRLARSTDPRRCKRVGLRIAKTRMTGPPELGGS